MRLPGRKSVRICGPRAERISPAFAHWSKITLTYPFQDSVFGGLSWLAIPSASPASPSSWPSGERADPSSCFTMKAFPIAAATESGTYACKVGAKERRHHHRIPLEHGRREESAKDKTPECTTIRNVRSTQQWALTNRGFVERCARGASCVPHTSCSTACRRIGLDPRKWPLKMTLRRTQLGLVTQYQKDNGFPQRQTSQGSHQPGKEAISWDKKWHSGSQNPFNPEKTAWASCPSTSGEVAAGNPRSRVRVPDPPGGKVAIVGMRAIPDRYRIRLSPMRGFRDRDEIRRHRDTGETVRQPRLPLCRTGRVLRHHKHNPQLILGAGSLKDKNPHYAVTPRPKDAAFFPGRKPGDLDIRESVVF